jgi:oxepin-CoA hydrolase/3-oxo-5,6-dehydrosuberyl-CoA semialdehyde dehydrogenase
LTRSICDDTERPIGLRSPVAVSGVGLNGSRLARDARRPELHEVEAFGPVAALIGYRGTQDVIELAALGKCSLVGSIVTEDPEFARDVILGTALWHGRSLVLDSDDPPSPPATARRRRCSWAPGPGRRRRGDGRMRAFFHHLQRTAIQASPRMVAAATGRWVKGALQP